MFTILGATGNTGGVVARKLLEQGQRVRVVGRDAAKLAKFTKDGAEAHVADVGDAESLTKAFTGAKAVYALIPPNVSAPDVRAYQERAVADLVTAAKKSGISHIVLLSSVGADKPDRTGPVIGLHNLEQQIAAIDGLNVLSLRPGYFMENVLPQVGVIHSMGMLAGPLRGDLRLPMIATRDIGSAAADALLRLDFKGSTTRELLGQRDVTYDELAKIVAPAIGKSSLSYRQAPNMMLRPVFMQMGMSGSMVDLLLEMCDALNAGYMKAMESRTAGNTTPTSIETFIAEEFVPAYQAKAATA